MFGDKSDMQCGLEGWERSEYPVTGYEKYDELLYLLKYIGSGIAFRGLWCGVRMSQIVNEVRERGGEVWRRDAGYLKGEAQVRHDYGAARSMCSFRVAFRLLSLSLSSMLTMISDEK
jgi:hypothetical protein